MLAEVVKYKSELGKLYQEKQSNAYLDKIVFDIYTGSEFKVRCGDTLPIEYEYKSSIFEPHKGVLTETELTYILDALHKRGCVVVVDSVTFTLTNLL